MRVKTLPNHIPRYMVDNNGMRIGELAARAEVNIQTLRFYEREVFCGRPREHLLGTAVTWTVILRGSVLFAFVKGWVSLYVKSNIC